ncbi:MAG: hypothetical protein AAFX03_14515 [Pseudomonadota bacterium]
MKLRWIAGAAALAACSACASAWQSAYYNADLDQCEDIVDAAARSQCELDAVEHRAERNAERLTKD